MSAWDNKPRATVIPIKGRKRNANRVIIPYVSLTNNLTEWEVNFASLRENNGQTRGKLEHLLGKDVGEIQEVTEVHRADGSIAYFELRLVRKNPHKDVSPK